MFTTKLAAFAVFVVLAAAFDASSNSNVAVYWGQASAGSQENLAYYCDSDDVDIVLLSFMSSFPGTDDIPTLNFASACSDTYSDGLLKCDQIATDISTCQSKGKKILLSLGGATGSYGFSSDSEAEEFAGTLWNYFGEGNATERPFGESLVDGFDFDIENSESTGYSSLVTKLREYFQSGSKDYYISASPQCVYPDAGVGDLLSNADVDFAFIQFYNNYCNVDKTFNWDTWTDFASNTSPNKNIKLFLGLPGSSSAAGSGYIDIDTLESTLSSISGSSSFGGVAIWDASQAFTNEIESNSETFVHAVKEALKSETGTTESSSLDSVTSISSSTSSSTTQSTTQSALTSSSITEEVLTSTTSDTASSSFIGSQDPTTTSFFSEVTTNTFIQSVGSTLSTVVVDLVAPETLRIPISISSIVSSDISTASSPTEFSSTPTATSAVQPSSSSAITTILEPSTITSVPAISSSLISSATSTAAQDSSSSTDCSLLNGLDKAKCLNAQFEAGSFLGSSTSCTDGEIACSADGQFAICDYGKWVTMQCASATTCYAYNQDSDVFVGCNYASEKTTFSKRSFEHSHHDHI